LIIDILFVGFFAVIDVSWFFSEVYSTDEINRSGLERVSTVFSAITGLILIFLCWMNFKRTQMNLKTLGLAIFFVGLLYFWGKNSLNFILNTLS